MPMDFPSSPTVGQQYNGYVWDGTAWDSTSAQPISLSTTAPGYNYIINGAFDIWQRGTSFTPTSGVIVYTADRFFTYRDGTGAVTVSQQTFTPGAAPLAGAASTEGTYFFRFAQTTAGTGAAVNGIYQYVEDVRTFAGQAVTLSFWAKADATRTITPQFMRGYGSGGSSGDSAITGSAITLTTSWVRYTQTLTLPSISGKTVGAGSSLQLVLNLPLNTAQTIDIWGVQLEAGSAATAFRRNAPSIQAELATCQRYYWRKMDTGTGTPFGNGTYVTTTSAAVTIPFPVEMRATPASIDFAVLKVGAIGLTEQAVSACTAPFALMNKYGAIVQLVHGAGGAGGAATTLYVNPNQNGYLGFSAEL